MKKFLVLAALAGVLVASVATQADARWTPRERIQWLRANTTENAVGGRAFDYTTGASAKVDTSASFWLTDCVPVNPALEGDSINAVGTLGAPSRSVVLQDTTLVAKIIISCDSTTATTQAWGSPSLVVQARFSPNAAWTTAATIAPKPTDAAKFCIFPIMNLPAQNDFGADLSQYAWWVGAECRFIITWGTGNVNAAYATLVKHVAD